MSPAPLGNDPSDPRAPAGAHKSRSPLNSFVNALSQFASNPGAYLANLWATAKKKVFILLRIDKEGAEIFAVFEKYGLHNLNAVNKFIFESDPSGIRSDFADMYAQSLKNGEFPNKLWQLMNEVILVVQPPNKVRNIDDVFVTLTDPKEIEAAREGRAAAANYVYGSLLHDLWLRPNPATGKPYIEIPGMENRFSIDEKAKYVNAKVKSMFDFRDAKEQRIAALAARFPDLAEKLSQTPAYMNTVSADADGRPALDDAGELALESDPAFAALICDALRANADAPPPIWTKGNEASFALGLETWDIKHKMVEYAIEQAKAGQNSTIVYDTWNHDGTNTAEDTKNYAGEMNQWLLEALSAGVNILALSNGAVANRSVGASGSLAQIKPLEEAGIPFIKYGSVQQGKCPGAAIPQSVVNANAVEPILYTGSHTKMFVADDMFQLAGQNTKQFYYEDSKAENQWLDGGVTLRGPIASEALKGQNEIVANFARTTIAAEHQREMLAKLLAPVPQLGPRPGAASEAMLATQVPAPRSNDTSTIAMLAPLVFGKGKVTVVWPYNMPMYPLKNDDTPDPVTQAILERVKRGGDLDLLKNSHASTDLPEMEGVSAPFINGIMNEVAALKKINPKTGTMVVYEKKGSNKKQPGDPVQDFWGTMHLKASYDEFGLYGCYSSQPHGEGASEIENMLIGIDRDTTKQMADRLDKLKDTHFTKYLQGDIVVPAGKRETLFERLYSTAPLQF